MKNPNSWQSYNLSWLQAVSTLLTVWFALAAPTCVLQAQTPPSGRPAPDSTGAQMQSDPAAAQMMETPLPSKVRGQVPFTAKYAIASEITYIPQQLFAFHNPYAGPSSLLSRNETELTHTYTLYLGARPI